jgi:putative GTP pyrophosphokinase
MNISNEKLNQIANLYRKLESIDSNDLKIIEDWRSTHYIVLTWVRRRITYLFQDNKDIVVVQRLKRMTTILDKLIRYKDMRLSSMQDIAGIRIICKDIEHLNQTFITLTKKHPKQKFNLLKATDYIEKPKQSGYRGIHCIFQYDNKGNVNTEQYDKLRVEVQIRTKIQHLWATAVEVATFYTQDNLKSSLGNKEWLNFFKLVADVFSSIEMNQVIDDKNKEILKILYNQLKVKNILSGVSLATNIIKNKKKRKIGIENYVLYLNLDTNYLSLDGYSDFKYAIAEYNKKEQDIKNRGKNNVEHVVLIPKSNVKHIEKSYQNFFLDTKEFINIIEKYINK